MGKISLEELENAGRLAVISVYDYQVVKYRVPTGRSGNFYIRVFQNGIICKNTAASLLEVANKLNRTELYSDNYNAFGDNIIQCVVQLENEKVVQQKKLEQAQLKAAKDSATLTQQVAVKTLQHPHISVENKKLLQSQITKVSQANTTEIIKIEQEALEALLPKINTENQASQEKAEAIEKARQAEIARQKAKKLRQDKLNMDIEELYHDYQKSLAEEKEACSLSESLQVLKHQNKQEHKKSLQVMISMLAVLVVGIFAGSNVYANQQALKEARTDLVKIEKKLQNSEKGYVSEKTKEQIKIGLADTKEIYQQAKRSQVIAETKRLKKLNHQALAEDKTVQVSVNKLKDLSQDKLTSKDDRIALLNLADKKEDYKALNPYQKHVSSLLTLVTAHNLRTNYLQTYQPLLANQDLSKANKTQLTADIKQLEAAKTADEITSLANQLDTDGKASQVQADKSRAARELNAAKQKAQPDISKAQALLGSSYISSTDRLLIQKDIDEINQAKTATAVADSQSSLIQDNTTVEKNNATAQKAAEDKAAAEEAAKQKAEADASAKAAADNQAAQESSANSGFASTTTNDGWTTAPAGQVFCASTGSMRYYTSVKNPGNYSLMSISDAQAAGYSAGHSNGFARN